MILQSLQAVSASSGRGGMRAAAVDACRPVLLAKLLLIDGRIAPFDLSLLLFYRSAVVVEWM